MWFRFARVLLGACVYVAGVLFGFFGVNGEIRVPQVVAIVDCAWIVTTGVALMIGGD
jgi:hypothetical protein